MNINGLISAVHFSCSFIVTNVKKVVFDTLKNPTLECFVKLNYFFQQGRNLLFITRILQNKGVK